MTANEAISELRTELGEYHSDVREHIVRCELCRKNVEKVVIDLYGPTGAPGGLAADVIQLRKSRKATLAGLWSILVLFIGATVASFFR